MNIAKIKASSINDLIQPKIIVNCDVIKDQIVKLKPKKAKGPDNICPLLLKLADNAIVPSLTDICQISARTATVPKTWKISRVCPLYNKDKVDEKSNYHPISLLCIQVK